MKFRVNTRTNGWIIESGRDGRWRKYAGAFNSRKEANYQMRLLRRADGEQDIFQKLISKKWDHNIFPNDMRV